MGFPCHRGEGGADTPPGAKGDKTMKVCKKCGTEIATKDGVNTCGKCKKQPYRVSKKDLEALGLVRVKGALGGVYYE